MVIQHNLIAMNAQRVYGINTLIKAKKTEKLSSGYKINRAADDAAGLAISEKMRRQIRGLAQGAENIQDGISLANVADGALHEIHDIMQRQRELLIKAGNDTNNNEDKEFIQEEIRQLSEEFDRIFDTTSFNERLIFKGKNKMIDGPDVTSSITGPFVNTINRTEQKKEVIWLAPGANPQNQSDVQNSTDTDTKSSSDHKEWVKSKDEYGHEIILEEYVDKVEQSVVDTEEKTDVTYTKITGADLAKQTALQTPALAISSNGYVSNLQNEARTLLLSCAMSQLGVRVDGNLVNISLYQSNSLGTTYSADGLKATTEYRLGSGLTLSQEVQRTADSTYQISYAVTNTDGAEHDVEVRFAFDTMNTYQGWDNGSGVKQYTTAVNDGTTTNFTLENDLARIQVSGSGDGGTLEKAMLGDIGDMYDDWDATKVVDGESNIKHTGTAYYWKGKVAAQQGTGAGAVAGTLRMGYVQYGPITFKKEPWEMETKKEIEQTTKRSVSDTVTRQTIMPEYIDIQSGPEAYTLIPMRLWNLSAEKLRVEAGTHISAFHVASSLENIDKAFEKIGNIRSYYGAITNRLEHAYKVNLNTEENTQAAESQIRDADMSQESMQFAKQNILTQVGEAMMAQANQSGMGVLSLLG